MTIIKLTMTGRVMDLNNIPATLEPITVEATGTDVADAVNRAVHKLSDLLSRREP